MRTPDPSTVRIDGPWQHRDVYANGIGLHIAEAGTGPLVLLLHGFAGFWWSWHRVIPQLAASGFRVVAADLRGYGDSDKPPRGYDGWTLAGDVAGLIRALGERRAHLVGHAWGGMLAWSTAALHSRVVESVSVLGSAHPLALRSAIVRTALKPGKHNQAAAAAELFRSQPPVLPERRLRRDDAAYVGQLLVAWAGPQWPTESDASAVITRHRDAMLVQAVAHSALEYHRWAVRSQLRGDGKRFADAVSVPVRVPVLQLHGEQDPCVLSETARRSTRWAGPRSRFQSLPDVGHLPHLETPAATVRALAEFLLTTCSSRY